MIKKILSLSELKVDTENPRIVENVESQKEALQYILEKQQKKILKLISDIVENGLSPIESFLVMPVDNDSNEFIVLEGNRRLAALKILENPNFVEGSFGDSLKKTLIELSRRYKENPINGLNCVIFDSREEAQHWIELKHTGQNEGAGVVPWGAAEAERFRRRSGQKPPHIQILDFLVNNSYISNEQRNSTPITSLKRLISTPQVRNKLGIDIVDGKVCTKLNEKEVSKGLISVVEDLSSKRIRTVDIYLADDRKKYVNNKPVDQLPDLSKEYDELSPLEDAIKSSEGKKPATKKKISKPSNKSRKTLIPNRNFSLLIDESRINDIYHELRSLNIREYTNAVSVLFRVFLELSLDCFICGFKLLVQQHC